MKLKILTLSNTEKGFKELPAIFHENVRPDVIKRAVEVQQSHRRQPYGTDPMAGQKQKGKLSRRRRDWKGSYGHGISRVQRKIMSHRGTQFNWVGAIAPGTVGGRKAHPPKASKQWAKNINVRERRLAIRSAIAATLQTELVKARGHVAPNTYPFIIDNAVEALAKTKDVEKALFELGFADELARSSVSTRRAGIARLRGRAERGRIGPLFVVSGPCKLLSAAKNIPGVDVCEFSKLNVEVLAPGSQAGRLALFSEAAIDACSKNTPFSLQSRKVKTRNAKAQSKTKPGSA
ncbi:50S ribosomal protein L4 [Candidatus Woesearchaeota archaeon]|nr:50S ribosomal protein L4 [Candidatus Woesearchaeota archaeon]